MTIIETKNDVPENEASILIDNDATRVGFPSVEIEPETEEPGGEKLSHDEIDEILNHPYSCEELRNMDINDFWEFDSEWNFHLKNELDNEQYMYNKDGKPLWGKTDIGTSKLDCKKIIRVNGRVMFSFVPIRGYWEPNKWITYYECEKWKFNILGNDGENFFRITFKSDWTKESWYWWSEWSRWSFGWTTYFDGKWEISQIERKDEYDYIIKYSNGNIYEWTINSDKKPDWKGKMIYVDWREEEWIRENWKFAYKKVE